MQHSNFKNKDVTVFGLGISGQAAAKRLVRLGVKVSVVDKKSESELPKELLTQLKELGVNLLLGKHQLPQTDVIVVSPGIHLDVPELKAAQQQNIPIISEIELAYQILSKPIIAVTGTNGKTTTTTLIGEMLKAGGKKVAVAGNIGTPLVSVDDSQLDYIVAEISSYQLETSQTFNPWVSLILNIQPDHLARHGSMAEYMRQKARIFANQSGDDYLIYNADDPVVVTMAKTAQAKLVPFSKQELSIITCEPSQIKIPGRHNLENALAATQAANLCGVSAEIIAKVLKSFPGVEHRIELVKEVRGVKYFNDSKATNPDSTLVALETFAGQPVVLILGGKDKGTDLNQLIAQVKKNAKATVLVGEAKARFAQALKQVGVAVHPVDSMEQVVQTSANLAQTGDIVLLSPACACFDMFSNFEERGRVFKTLVEQL